MVKNKSNNIYFFSGTNETAKEKVVAEIKSKVLGSNASEFNYDLLYADAMPVVNVIDIANTLPFDNPNRLIILKRVEKYTAKDKKILLEYADKPSEFTVLVVCQSIKPNKREAWYKKFALLSTEKVFWPYNDKQVMTNLRQELALKNINISNDALLYFAQMTTNLANIDTEIEKLVDYCKGKEVITVEDVKMIVSDSVTHDIYDWASKITDRRYKQALKVFQRFSPKEMGAPQLLLYVVTDRFIKILRYNTMLREGLPMNEAQRNLGIIKFLDPNFHGMASRYKDDELAKIFEILLKSDYALKTGRGTSQLLFEKMIIDVARSKQS